MTSVVPKVRHLRSRTSLEALAPLFCHRSITDIIGIGTHVLLGPTVNTQRSPLGGRGFESFAEDPYLNGNVAAAYINGLQSKGVAATIKHFVANDQEFER